MDLITLMGPAGCGKSTIGKALAAMLDVTFLEGDDFHSAHNKTLIAQGTPLSHLDRLPWAAAIATAVQKLEGKQAVLACSALYDEFRTVLDDALAPVRCHYIRLDVPRDILLQRLSSRQGHFAGPSILDSQLAQMDHCEGIPIIDATQPLEKIIQDILSAISPESLGST